MKFLPEDKPDQHVIAWLTARSGSALKVLDRHLFTQEWIAADHLTIADLSCVGYLYYDHEFGHDLHRLSRTSSAGATRSPPSPAGSTPTT